MRRTSRRSCLVAAATAGASVAGCLVGGSRGVNVLAAGSLATTVEDHVGPAFEADEGTPVEGEYHGTNALLRMVEDGTKRPDVVLSADATLLRDRLYGSFTDWDVEFATNSLGLCYRADTAFGAAIEAGQPWYGPALDADEGDLAISNPDLDPLGYRAVLAFELAEREHGVEGLAADLLALAYEEPEEPQLLAGVESGARAAAVAYRNMAVDHDLPFAEFPDAYDFADPTLADHYATVSYTTDDGYTAEGRPILYNATVLADADRPDAGHRFVQYLLDNPGLLADAGLSVGEALPRVSGDPPGAIEV